MRSHAILSSLIVSCLLAPLGAQEQAEKPPEIRQLIEQLGDPSYRTRQKAENTLRELGSSAAEALSQAAEKHEDSEVRWRASRLVRQIHGGDDDGSLQERVERPRVRWARPGTPQLDESFEDLFEQLERRFEMDIPRHRFFNDEFFQDLQEQMDELRRQTHALQLDDFGPGASGRMLEISIGPDGVVVRVQEQNENGEVETKTYEADDLESFRAEYPDVAERFLDGGRRGGVWGFRHPGVRFEFPGGGVIPQSPLRLRGGLPGAAPASGPRLGVMIGELSDNLREYLDLEPGTGLLVQSVSPGTLAERLGIEARDIVVEINGSPIRSPADVRKALSEAGEKVEVRVNRRGEERVLEADNDAVSEEPEELAPRNKKAVIR